MPLIKMQICDSTFEMQFYLTVHGTYLTSIITEHMALEATIGQKLEHNIARRSKTAMSLLNVRHSTITRTKNFTEEIKATMFLQHVKYQDLLTGYVRVIRKHGGKK